MQEVEAQKTKAQVYKTEKDQIIAKNEENQVEMMEKHGKEMQDIGKYFKMLIFVGLFFTTQSAIQVYAKIPFFI